MVLNRLQAIIWINGGLFYWHMIVSLGLSDLINATWGLHYCMHYDDVIMTMLASQITSLTVVYSIIHSGVNQRKHQSSASLAFVREIHRGPVNFPHKWPVTRKMFPFDDVIMCELCHCCWCCQSFCSHCIDCRIGKPLSLMRKVSNNQCHFTVEENGNKKMFLWTIQYTIIAYSYIQPIIMFEHSSCCLIGLQLHDGCRCLGAKQASGHAWELL